MQCKENTINVIAPLRINTSKAHVLRHEGTQPCWCCQLNDYHMYGVLKRHLSPSRGVRTRVLVGLILLSKASPISPALRAALQHVPDRTRLLANVIAARSETTPVA